ncbi:uncharacterized protein LOC143841715 isoform X1 [Paroedura picta]|uniref:uncharacterized protein LOC143841715 isoform X1 n=1 Tax=Paroedura picta TaxID=143630 RepID=UPI004056D8F2
MEQRGPMSPSLPAASPCPVSENPTCGEEELDEETMNFISALYTALGPLLPEVAKLQGHQDPPAHLMVDVKAKLRELGSSVSDARKRLLQYNVYLKKRLAKAAQEKKALKEQQGEDTSEQSARDFRNPFAWAGILLRGPVQDSHAKLDSSLQAGPKLWPGGSQKAHCKAEHMEEGEEKRQSSAPGRQVERAPIHWELPLPESQKPKPPERVHRRSARIQEARQPSLGEDGSRPLRLPAPALSEASCDHRRRRPDLPPHSPPPFQGMP